MELQHSFTVPADVDTAWATLLDLEAVTPCFPGATLTGRDGDEFSGQVRVKLGPVSLQYAGKGRFVERDDATHRAVIEAHGRDKRGNGTAGATVVAHLEAEDDSSTRVVVATQLKVTGRPAQFGRGVMQDVGGRIVDQFAGNLARQLGGETAPAEPAAGAAAGTPPTGTPSAAPATAEPTIADVTPAETAAAEAMPAERTVAGSSTAPPPAASSAGPEPVSFADRTGTATAQRAPAPRPTPVRSLGGSGIAPGRQEELDLNAVVLPTLLRRYGATAATVLVTMIVTWWLARRRYRR